MKGIMVIGIWSAAAAAVLAMLFAPQIGLLQGGPMAAVGMMLLGMAICKQANQTRAAMVARSARRS